jgi:hypothetical protein
MRTNIKLQSWEEAVPWVKEYRKLVTKILPLTGQPHYDLEDLDQYDNFFQECMAFLNKQDDAILIHVNLARRKEQSVSVEEKRRLFKEAITNLIELLEKPIRDYHQLVEKLDARPPGRNDADLFTEQLKACYVAAHRAVSSMNVNPLYSGKSKGQFKEKSSEEIAREFAATKDYFANRFSAVLNDEIQVLQQKLEELSTEDAESTQAYEENKKKIEELKKQIKQEIEEIEALLHTRSKRSLAQRPGIIPLPPPPPPLRKALAVQANKPQPLAHSKEQTPRAITATMIGELKLRATPIKVKTTAQLDSVLTSTCTEAPMNKSGMTLAFSIFARGSIIAPSREVNPPSLSELKKPKASIESLETKIDKISLKVFTIEQTLVLMQERRAVQIRLHEQLNAQKIQLTQLKEQLKKEIDLVKDIKEKRTAEGKTSPLLSLSPLEMQTTSLPPTPPPPPSPLLKIKRRPAPSLKIEKSQAPPPDSKTAIKDKLQADLQKALGRRRSQYEEEDTAIEEETALKKLERAAEKKRARQQAILERYRKSAAEKQFSQSADTVKAVSESTKKIAATTLQLTREIDLLYCNKFTELDIQARQFIEELRKEAEEIQFSPAQTNNAMENTQPAQLDLASSVPQNPSEAALLTAPELQISSLSKWQTIISQHETLKHQLELATAAEHRLINEILIKGIEKAKPEQLTLDTVSDLLILQAYATKTEARINFYSEKDSMKCKEELIAFYTRAIDIRLSEHDPATQCQLLLAAAKDNFHHRDSGLRLFADVLLVLSSLAIVGLALGGFRMLSGHSFFFSKSPTQRESDFIALLKNESKEKLFIAPVA